MQFFAFYACKVIYRIYFHPLSSYPGPKLAAATRLWYIYKLYCGELPQTIAALHREYGSVLRVAPDELTYTSSESWKDIYGFRSGKPEMAKESPFYKVPTNHPSIITAERNRHGHFRKLMSRGFSDSALREQEPIIQNFVTLLMQRLRERSNRGEAVNMVSWFNVCFFPGLHTNQSNQFQVYHIRYYWRSCVWRTFRLSQGLRISPLGQTHSRECQIHSNGDGRELLSYYV